MSVAPIPSSRKLPLGTGGDYNYNWSNFTEWVNMGRPNPAERPAVQPLHSRARKRSLKGEWTERLQGPEDPDTCCEILASIYHREIAFMNFNKTGRMTIPAGMLKRTGETLQGLTHVLEEDQQATHCGEGDPVLSKGSGTVHVHMNKTKWTK